MIGAGHPCFRPRYAAISAARTSAAWCSSSVDETPLGLTGSRSIGSHRLRTTSLSLVVGSFRPRFIFTRLALRERRAGSTSLRVTYTPATSGSVSRFAAFSARTSKSSKYPLWTEWSDRARSSTTPPLGKSVARVFRISPLIPDHPGIQGKGGRAVQRPPRPGPPGGSSRAGQ